MKVLPRIQLTSTRLSRSLLVLVAVLAAGPVDRAVGAMQLQTQADEMPKQLENVDLTERLGNQMPGELTFLDLENNEVQLGDYFEGHKPIIFTLNYATCPKLCGLQLQGLAQALGELNLDPGMDYDLLTISLDPEELPEQTIAVSKGFLSAFGRMVDPKAWHFLRGEAANIRLAADSVGFEYERDEKTGEYMHPALAMVLSPDGRVMRYVRGLAPEKFNLRLALLEAAEGKQGKSLGDRILLFCYSYDPDTGQYTPAAWRLMRTAAVLTLVFLAAGFWKLQRSRAREENQ